MKSLQIALAVAASMFLGTTANAATIFFDDFESGTLSNWALTQTASTITNVSFGGSRVMNFAGGEFLVSDDGIATATSSIPSTAGYTNLQLSFLWSADNDNESSGPLGIGVDTLQAQWRVAGSGPWFTIGTFSSDGNALTNSGLLNISAAPGTDIDIRFIANMGASDEGFRIDNVLLQGNQVAAVPGPMVGAGLPGLALAFGSLMLWYRRRQAAC